MIASVVLGGAGGRGFSAIGGPALLIGPVRISSASTTHAGHVNTVRALADALRKNSTLRVLVASGYQDMVTPFFDAEYTFDRHDILRERIQMKYYEAGHMMYARQADFDALLRDSRAF